MSKVAILSALRSQSYNGALGTMSEANLEKMLFIFELFDKYPRFLTTVREEYDIAGSKSTWNINKVCCIFDFVCSDCMLFYVDKLCCLLPA